MLNTPVGVFNQFACQSGNVPVLDCFLTVYAIFHFLEFMRICLNE